MVSIKNIKIPEGLNELMFDISREVLRSQPKKITLFIADYLESMVIRREHLYIAEENVDSVLNDSMNIVNCVQKLGIDLDRATKAARVIQNNFRKHLKMINETGRYTFSNIRNLNTIEELMALGIIKDCEAKSCLSIIYPAFEWFYYQQLHADKLIKTCTTRRWLDCIENTLKIYRMSKPLREKMKEAAITIQAAYKGHYFRKYRLALSELRKITDVLIFEGKYPIKVIQNEVIKPNLDYIFSYNITNIKDKSENDNLINSNIQDILVWSLTILHESLEHYKDKNAETEASPIDKVKENFQQNQELPNNLKESQELLLEVVNSISINEKEFAAQIIQQAYKKYLKKKISKIDVTIVSSIPDSDVSKFEKNFEFEVQVDSLSQKIPNVNIAVPPAPFPSLENLFDNLVQINNNDII